MYVCNESYWIPRTVIPYFIKRLFYSHHEYKSVQVYTIYMHMYACVYMYIYVYVCMYASNESYWIPRTVIPYFIIYMYIYYIRLFYIHHEYKSIKLYIIKIHMVAYVLKSPKLSMNFHDNSKDKNRNIDFSFVSAYSASLMICMFIYICIRMHAMNHVRSHGRLYRIVAGVHTIRVCRDGCKRTDPTTEADSA